MALALFVGYVVTELLAFGAVVHYLGLIWALVLLIAGTGLGVLLAGGQIRRVTAGVRAALNGERGPGSALADGALVAVGTVLVFVPGFVTTVLGLALLTPPGRWMLRPLLTAAAARRVSRASQGPVVIEGTVVSEGSWRALDKWQAD